MMINMPSPLVVVLSQPPWNASLHIRDEIPIITSFIYKEEVGQSTIFFLRVDGGSLYSNINALAINGIVALFDMHVLCN